MPEPLRRRRGWRPAQFQPALLVVPAVDGAGAGWLGVVEAGGSDPLCDVRARRARGEQALSPNAQRGPGVGAGTVARAPWPQSAQMRTERLMPGGCKAARR